MNKSLRIGTILILVFCPYASALAQESESNKTIHTRSISKQLSMPDTDARKVVAVMDDYKLKVQNIQNEQSLSPEKKRRKIDSLISIKNGHLRKLLNKEQQQKFIPSTEVKNNN